MRQWQDQRKKLVLPELFLKKIAKEATHNKKKGILSGIVLTLPWVGLCLIVLYAIHIGHIGLFLDFTAEFIVAFGLSDLAVSCFVMVFGEKGKEHKTHWRCFVIFSVTTVIVFVLDIAALSKIWGAALTKEDNQIIVIKDNEQILGENEKPVVTIESITYILDEDYYMEEILWQEYYSEDSQESLYEIKAQVLYNNLKYNQPKGNLSVHFTELTEIADTRYEFYLFQKKQAGKNGDNSSTLFEDRIETLQKALHNREEAEVDFENLDNEKCLATGYKDMGDEYFARNMQNDAMAAYRSSTEWCMKWIYHAAAMKDYKKMNMGIELFRKINQETVKLTDISQTRTDQITEMLKVYETFTDIVQNNRH